MIKYILVFCYILLSLLVVYYIDDGIKSFDLSYYSGKDGGYFVRFKSILLLTSLFYILIEILNKSKFSIVIILGLFGGFIALIVSILNYLFLPTDEFGLTFHLVSLVLSFSAYLIIKKVKLDS
jgi:hypothetical protein